MHHAAPLLAVPAQANPPFRGYAAFPALSRFPPDKPLGPFGFNDMANAPASWIENSRTADPGLALHKEHC
jgi:hypothetical protein